MKNSVCYCIVAPIQLLDGTYNIRVDCDNDITSNIMQCIGKREMFSSDYFYYKWKLARAQYLRKIPVIGASWPLSFRFGHQYKYRQKMFGPLEPFKYFCVKIMANFCCHHEKLHLQTKLNKSSAFFCGHKLTIQC